MNLLSFYFVKYFLYLSLEFSLISQPRVFNLLPSHWLGRKHGLLQSMLTYIPSTALEKIPEQECQNYTSQDTEHYDYSDYCSSVLNSFQVAHGTWNNLRCNTVLTSDSRWNAAMRRNGDGLHRTTTFGPRAIGFRFGCLRRSRRFSASFRVSFVNEKKYRQKCCASQSFHRLVGKSVLEEHVGDFL
ncbi:hypothetical protein BDZ97DRAFT_1780033 [Flammula alnicola]|nr:hypothetical protein BDZ97DRAFT_1780033 [Flammula alnicola]